MMIQLTAQATVLDTHAFGAARPAHSVTASFGGGRTALS